MLNHAELRGCLRWAFYFVMPRSGAPKQAVLTARSPHTSPYYHQLLLNLQVPAETFPLHSFPGCLRNRTWSPSTSSLQRRTIISLNHNCLLASKPVYPRLSALEGWAGVRSPMCPAKCPEWQPPSQIPAEWKCC